MSIINPTLPEISEANTTADPKLRDALAQLLGVVNGGIDAANAPSLSALINAGLGKRFLIHETGGVVSGGLGGFRALISPGVECELEAGRAHTRGIFWFDPADYAVAGKTLKLCWDIYVATNGNIGTNLNFIFQRWGDAHSPANHIVDMQVYANTGADQTARARSAEFDAPAVNDFIAWAYPDPAVTAPGTAVYVRAQLLGRYV